MNKKERKLPNNEMQHKKLANIDDFIKIFGKNLVPTDEYMGYKIRPGFYLLNGATMIPGGVSFTIHSQNATSCKLALFSKGENEPSVVIPFPDNYRIGDVFSMIVFDLDIDDFEYAYMMDGPHDESKGLIFDKDRYLLDPYSKVVAGQRVWAEENEEGFFYKGAVTADDFDWGDFNQLNIPMSDLVIYELHVRGFTMDPSSEVKNPGTFAGIIEKISYLKELGINAVELMPIFEFDEMLNKRTYNNIELYDYWGYNTISFYAPNTSYSSSHEGKSAGRELKELIKALHENGIEVILDVVFNHTAEGNEEGPFISYKGLDNNVYYMLTPNGQYYNFSGCGNTVNSNHPVVQRMIIDCLRHWVIEYRVDGFRFDLASILGRDEDGSPMNNPPLLKALAFDPILSSRKLIAEAWDAGGLYQVGSFPSYNKFSEWNGKYRDDLRRFLKGDAGLATVVADRIAGSHDIYHPTFRADNASVNFITCHDGFTLYDLYSYNEKQNEDNGWDNTDGTDANYSWNCGIEGETDDEVVLDLRMRMIKNAASVLFASQGTPMFFAGDEFGNTQFGNNNAYCQDNEISWINWDLKDKNKEILEFFKKMISLRKKHPVLREQIAPARCGLAQFSKHGEKAWYLDPSPETRVLGVMLAGSSDELEYDDIAYIAINAHWEKHNINMPKLPKPYVWKVAVNTALDSGQEIVEKTEDMANISRNRIEMTPRSVQILFAVPRGKVKAKKK